MPWLLKVQFGDIVIKSTYPTKGAAVAALLVIETNGYSENDGANSNKFYSSSIIASRIEQIEEGP